jgi:hypothetical protein
MRWIEERRQWAVEHWAKAMTTVTRARWAIDRRRWLIDSSRALLARPKGLIRGGSEGESANFAPLLQIGQPVRRLDGSDVGVVVGIIFGTPEQAIVRWVDGSRLEPVEGLIEVGKLTERPVMNKQPDAAHLIRAKVLIGQLPKRTTTKSWVGYGSGLLCDGCDQPITATDVEHAVDAIGLGTLHFHKRCMQFWETASAIPRDLADGSALFRLAPSRRGVFFTDGICDKSAARLHPAFRPMVVRRKKVPKSSYAAIVAIALVVMIGLMLGARTIFNVPTHEVSPPSMASPQRKSPPPRMVTRPLQESPTSPKAPPRHGASITSRRHSHTIQGASSESSASVNRASHPPLPAVPAETSALRTEQILYQAP